MDIGEVLNRSVISQPVQSFRTNWPMWVAILSACTGLAILLTLVRPALESLMIPAPVPYVPPSAIGIDLQGTVLKDRVGPSSCQWGTPLPVIGPDPFVDSVIQVMSELHTKAPHRWEEVLRCLPKAEFNIGEVEKAGNNVLALPTGYFRVNGHQAQHNDDYNSFRNTFLHEVGHNVGVAYYNDPSEHFADFYAQTVIEEIRTGTRRTLPPITATTPVPTQVPPTPTIPVPTPTQVRPTPTLQTPPVMTWSGNGNNTQYSTGLGDVLVTVIFEGAPVVGSPVTIYYGGFSFTEYTRADGTALFPSLPAMMAWFEVRLPFTLGGGQSQTYYSKLFEIQPGTVTRKGVAFYRSK